MAPKAGSWAQTWLVYLGVCTALNLAVNAVGVAGAADQSGAEPATAAEHASQPVSTAIRIDCMHDFNATNGSAQPCLSLSGLRLNLYQQTAPNLRSYLRIDPFATPRLSRATSPLRASLPVASDSALGLVDQFSLIWTARPSLDLAIQTFGGATLLPSVSGLAMGNQLMDAGWKQVAVTLDYALNLPVPMHVTLIAGNGEGQTIRPVTPQQYFGVQASMTLFGYMNVVIAGSANGNDAGSEEQKYVKSTLAATCGIAVSDDKATKGHSNRRMAAGLSIDGAWVGLDGLKVGGGWQSSLTKDMAADLGGYPSAAQLEESTCRLDPDIFFIEQAGTVGSLRRTTVNAGVRQRFGSGIYIAADYSQRRITANGDGLFRVCESYVNGRCSNGRTGGQNQLNQTAWAVGVGTPLAQDLELSLEYFSAGYDQTYANFYYAGADGQADRDFALFNARLAYRWQ